MARRFRLEAALGLGGMATVYRARDERTGQLVALKCLRDAREGEDETIARQFEREYHVLCQLNHPSIITVFDYGIDERTPYYTMELLEGDDLHRAARLSWRETCGVLRDIASSLAILHSRRLLHRDISTRNVRRTLDGRAKLIDFGAMAAMGVCKQIVGTPPFIPPEALHLQSLDGGADLYALGALGYYLLTGYHAYHARSLNQLEAVWQSPALPVREYAPEVPPALDALLTELLQLERYARPSRAAEVMVRVCTIAELPLQELPSVSRAYLTTPRLVGRLPQLEALRSELKEVAAGAMRCVVLRGEPGCGRSRLLDTAVLEAKLLGAVVLRADAADALAGEYGVVRSLCRQLVVELPDLWQPSLQFGGAVLAHLVPQWSAKRAAAMPGASVLHDAFRAWLVWIARQHRLVPAIDDVESIDATSAALLATLFQAPARTQLGVVLATRSGPGHGAVALPWMQQLGRTLELVALDATQSEALLRSVFGNVAHVASMAHRIHGLSGGNPRTILALCERLVERGTARYEAGSWELPAQLTTADIPDTLAAALAQRVAALSNDARELLQALSITDPSAHPSTQYVALSSHRDPERCYRALDALISAGLLTPVGDRYRFCDDMLPPLLESQMSQAHVRSLHARIAGALPAASDAILRARHAFLAGHEAESIELLACQPDEAFLSGSARVLATLVDAVDAAPRVHAPLSQYTRLCARLVAVAAHSGEYALFNRYAWPLLGRLQRDSGLSDYDELASQPDSARRLVEARARAERRRNEAAEPDRSLPPAEATTALAALYANASFMAAIAQDGAMLARLPSLAPLYPVNRSLALADLSVEAQRHMQAARYSECGSAYRAIVQRLERPEQVDLTSEVARFNRFAVCVTLGGMAAMRGSAEALQWCEVVQDDPNFRVHTWRLRMIYELMRGNPSMATACQRRAELLHLQGTGQIAPHSNVRVELLSDVAALNLFGVKRAVERIKELATLYSGWAPTLAIARALYRRLQGDPAGALLALEPALQLEPWQHIDWVLARNTQIALLTQLGRAQDALQVAAEQRTHIERVAPGSPALLETYALAYAAAGELDRAASMISVFIERLGAEGVGGLYMAQAYESAARIALARGNQSDLQHYLELSARQFMAGSRNPVFKSRYELLTSAIEASGLTAPAIQCPPSPSLREMPAVRFEQEAAR